MAAAPAVQALPGCRFYVAIDGIHHAVFLEAEGLGVDVEVEEIEEGGNNDFVHRRPGRCRVGTLTLKRGLTTSNEFLKWSLEIARGKLVQRNVSVMLFNPDGSEAMRWDYIKAYPIKWTGPQLRSDDTASAIETLELAHEGIKIG
jgi:phage tail-like protein